MGKSKNKKMIQRKILQMRKTKKKYGKRSRTKGEETKKIGKNKMK